MEEEERDILANVTDYKDIPEEEKPDIASVSLEDLVGEIVIICAYREKDSEFGKEKYIIMDVLVDGEMCEVSTGANAVLKQVLAAASKFPIRVTVKQKGRKYYLE